MGYQQIKAAVEKRKIAHAGNTSPHQSILLKAKGRKLLFSVG